jgi:hypothetical protein
MATHKVRIFPPIGIARLGNSEVGYFIGPEIPDDAVAPAGGYRDSGGFIKRQAARFHLFAYDENDALTGEITADHAEITWTVHLSNTKAGAERFHPKSETSPPLRNASFVTNRNQLNLDPGMVSVGGRNPEFLDLGRSKAAGVAKDLMIDQLFLNAQIRLILGTVTTDDKGLLLVLGGHGESKSPVGASLSGGDFADHDGWYDDISDGRISAVVKMNDGGAPAVVDAWVIVAPPKYAPGLRTIVTLYDSLEQSAVDRKLKSSPFVDPQFKPSFAKHIYPILLRAANMRWVYSNGNAQFSVTEFHRFLNSVPPVNRAVIFNRLSIPSTVSGNPGVGGGDMPRMWSDLYPSGPNGTVTAMQYTMLQMWNNGNFLNDWSGSPVAPPTEIAPDGLTRAAMEPCVGAAFFPGIEASWKLRDEYPFLEAFRLDSLKISPGDITKQMSLPWQSDFLDCAVEQGNAGVDLVWWPSQRPIDVLSAGTGDNYISWARAMAPGSAEMTVEQMVADWYRLGFIVKQSNGRYEEVDRR